MYSVDWDTRIITVPQSDLVDLGGGIYKLDLELCHQELRRLEWEFFDGFSQPQILQYISPLEAGGVIYARFVLLMNGYRFEFEDGQYAVNLVGANTNIHDYTIVNQVSIRPTNSAGLQDLSTLLASAYNGKVTINVPRGQSGTAVPIGTLSTPSNNVTDAIEICAINGIGNLFFQSNMTLTQNLARLKVIGESHVMTFIDVAYDAVCDHTVFEDVNISGILDGDSELTNCVVGDIVYFNGHIHDSALEGTIYLGGSKPAKFVNCSMGDFTKPVEIDCGGSGQNVIIDYKGLITISNLTGANTIGLSMSGGIVTLDSTCTAGTIILQGNFELVDNSGAGCTVITTEKLMVHDDIAEIANTVLDQDAGCP